MEFHGLTSAELRCGAATVRLLRSRSDLVDDRAHTHQEPHFLLALDEGFNSEAWRYDSRLEQLIFTPAGIEHRDSMARLHGRFAIITVDAALVDVYCLPDHSTADLSVEMLQAAHRIVAKVLEPRREVHREIEAMALLMFDRADKSRGLPAAKIIDEARKLMSDDPRLSLKEIASLLDTDVRALARAQRNVRREPLQALRSWCRAEATAARLRSSNAPLAAVATEVGYSDQSHMTRHFRRHFRLTPREYRQLFERSDSFEALSTSLVR